jgi:DUF1009 family protein
MQTHQSIHTLGIIAGSRTLPLLVATEARKGGIQKIAAVAFEGETDPRLASMVDAITWVRVGQLSKMVSAFRQQGVDKCVMAGQIAPKNLFEVRPDLRAMMMLFRLKEKNAHTIFGAIGDELAREGITLIEATPWLKPAMPQPGFHLGPKLSKAYAEDVEFGFRIAKEVSRMEIGQTVVVKDGVVLAVEGFEGTDQCLARGGELAGSQGGAVAVKVAKPNHDMRFDIPCIGAQTVRVCQKAGVKVLALEAGKTILLEREEVESLVNRKGPSIVTVV